MLPVWPPVKSRRDAPWSAAGWSSEKRNRIGAGGAAVRAFERRATGAFPYLKLAECDAVGLTWRDGKRAFSSKGAAMQSTERRPGRYRVSEVSEAGRKDFEPFDVSG